MIAAFQVLVAAVLGAGVIVVAAPAEDNTGAGCVAEPADIDLFIARIEEYLAQAGRFDRQPVLTIAWSIGSLPSAGFAEALFSAIDPYIADGRVAWKTVDEMAVLLSAG